MRSILSTFTKTNQHYTRKCIFNFMQQLQCNQSQNPFTCTISRRFYPELAKRFYADTFVEPVDDHYEISLDGRKLKTPKQNVFKVQSEGLAHMIATEWSAQRKHISISTMHLTALANTTQDNPLHKTKPSLINEILNVLEEDTILYYAVGDSALMNLQMEKWKPILDWFDQEFKVKVPVVLDTILPPEIPELLKESLRQYLESLSYESVQGIAFGVGGVRSVILAIAAIKGRLTPEEAVHLSRLEISYQTGRWGNVEYFHDVELYDSISRLSAGVLYCQHHFNT